MILLKKNHTKGTKAGGRHFLQYAISDLINRVRNKSWIQTFTSWIGVDIHVAIAGRLEEAWREKREEGKSTAG